MGFVLTEEQESIRKAAREFATRRLPVAEFRKLRDARDDAGFSRGAWRELCELGLASASLPEAHGGAGLGMAEVGLVMEELGRTLAATPMLSTIVLSAGALALAGDEAQKARELPAIAAGERLVAFAHDEGIRHSRFGVATAAARSGGEWRVSGEKTHVLDAHVADAWIVSARVSGAPGDRAGLGLFLVPRSAPGASVRRLSVIDARNVGVVRFEGATAEPLGEPGGAAATLDAVLDRGCAALAAEMLGGASEAFERTLGYLKERRQFGVLIGSFQALKHRAATMFCELELAKSVSLDALRALDSARPDASAMASVAKARLWNVFIAVAAEAVQMHGGIGVTDEHDIGLFYKRARVAELTFGGGSFHRDRWARLQGF